MLVRGGGKKVHPKSQRAWESGKNPLIRAHFGKVELDVKNYVEEATKIKLAVLKVNQVAEEKSFSARIWQVNRIRKEKLSWGKEGWGGEGIGPEKERQERA